jgi:hypothetical protein
MENRCESCLSINTEGRNVTCRITGSIIGDISKINFDCPLNKELTYETKTLQR